MSGNLGITWSVTDHVNMQGGSPLVGPALGYGLLGVWIVNGVYRTGQAINTATQWAGRKWTHIRI